MLNYLWSFMILTGIVYAAFTGRMPDITNAALDSSKEAISLCITMIDVMSFWIGLMKISFEAGIIPTASIIGGSILSPMIALLLLSSIVN